MNLLNSLIPSRACSPVSASKEAADVRGASMEPSYKIRENAEDFSVTVNLPGVAKTDLEITSQAETLRIVGKRGWSQPESWNVLHRETSDRNFLLELEYDSGINVEKIQAELQDGVLRLNLPKAEAVKPRKITVG